MADLIERRAVIDALDVGAEALRHILDTVDIVGAEREKYKLGLGLIESRISDIKELPSAQPDLQQICNKLATDCKWKKNIILEIDKTIEEVRHNGKHHAKFVRENGELVIFGLEIAKYIIEKGEEDG